MPSYLAKQLLKRVKARLAAVESQIPFSRLSAQEFLDIIDEVDDIHSDCLQMLLDVRSTMGSGPVFIGSWMGGGGSLLFLEPTMGAIVITGLSFASLVTSTYARLRDTIFEQQILDPYWRAVSLQDDIKAECNRRGL